jgi:hypothetical protein
MLPEALLVLDALVALRDDRPPTLRVGEVKTCPDRGGYTDSTELATTRAQAGVYVHGLRLVLDELRGFARLRDAAKITPKPDKDNPIEAVQRAATRYCDACVQFCDRASLCSTTRRIRRSARRIRRDGVESQELRVEASGR